MFVIVQSERGNKSECWVMRVVAGEQQGDTINCCCYPAPSFPLPLGFAPLSSVCLSLLSPAHMTDSLFH